MLIYDVWIASKVSRLNALKQQYLIPFCLKGSLGSTYFRKEYLFITKKRLSGVIIPWEIMLGSGYFSANKYWGVIF